VKNWVHADRIARIIIPVSVEYDSDPLVVERLLLDAALANREVLSEPKPIVIFKNLGDTKMDFELRCFVDIDSMLTTRSQLLFDIFDRLKVAGVTVAASMRVQLLQEPALAPVPRPEREQSELASASPGGRKSKDRK
jgi:small-conductance mechanosensitive channel